MLIDEEKLSTKPVLLKLWAIENKINFKSKNVGMIRIDPTVTSEQQQQQQQKQHSNNNNTSKFMTVSIIRQPVN